MKLLQSQPEMMPGIRNLILATICMCMMSPAIMAMDSNGGGLLNVHIDGSTHYEYPDQAPIDDPGLIIDFADLTGGAGCGDLTGDCELYGNEYPGCTYGSDLDPDLELGDSGSISSIYKIVQICGVFPDTTCVELKKVEIQIVDFDSDSLMILDFGIPDGATFTATPNWPNNGGTATITYQQPLTNHVAQLCWIAVVPSAAGSIDFGIAKFYYNEVDYILSSDDTPIAAFGDDGYNPVFPEDVPVLRVCCDEGECNITTAAECIADGKTWMSDEDACDPNPCAQPERACCFGLGECLVVEEAACDGDWLAGETSCDPNPCEVFATCCLPDGSCDILTSANCSDNGGIWYIEIDNCADVDCPQPAAQRACCLRDGQCSVITLTECSGMLGSWYEERETCDVNPCPQPLACCLPDGACLVMLPLPCSYQGGLLYEGIASCAPIDCNQPLAACCFDAGMINQGGCRLITEDECDEVNGEWKASFSTCDANPCRLRACCVQTGGIYICIGGMMRNDECDTAGGIWTLDSDDCDPNPCYHHNPSPTDNMSWGKVKTLYRAR